MQRYQSAYGDTQLHKVSDEYFPKDRCIHPYFSSHSTYTVSLRRCQIIIQYSTCTTVSNDRAVFDIGWTNELPKGSLISLRRVSA
jgi:hypothetical protein